MCSVVSRIRRHRHVSAISHISGVLPCVVPRFAPGIASSVVSSIVAEAMDTVNALGVGFWSADGLSCCCLRMLSIVRFSLELFCSFLSICFCIVGLGFQSFVRNRFNEV
jgi:hypothetical protein